VRSQSYDASRGADSSTRNVTHHARCVAAACVRAGLRVRKRRRQDTAARRELRGRGRGAIVRTAGSASVSARAEQSSIGAR
jgi:hypothetical protein